MLRPLLLVACLIACSITISAFTAEPATGTTAGETAPATTKAAAIIQVLREAEALGLAKLEDGATFWFEPSCPNPDHPQWQIPEVHARLPDGRWLLALTEERPADALPPARIATFTTLDRAGLFSRVHGQFWSPNLPLVLVRCLALGDDKAFAALLEYTKNMRFWRSMAGNYPRPTVSDDAPLADWTRLEYATLFLKQAGQNRAQQARWQDAALAILPAATRHAFAQDCARYLTSCTMTVRPVTEAEPVLTDVWEALSRIDTTRPSSRNTAPGIDDSTLVGVVGDLQAMPGTTSETFGDRVLNLLERRWGFDPMIVTSRNRSAIWDDAERTALATDLRAWWDQHRNDTPLQRLTAALTQGTWQEAFRICTARGENSMYEGDQQPSKHRTPIVLPSADELMTAARPVLIQRLHQSPILETDADVDALRRLLGLLNNDPVDPDLAAALAAWPRSGRMAQILAEWDDVHGRHQEYDRLMSDWWIANAEGKRALSCGSAFVSLLNANVSTYTDWKPDGLLAGWVQRPTPERWQRMRDSVRRDEPSDSDLRFRFAIGTLFGRTPYGRPPLNTDPLNTCALPLLWLGLQDTRPLPSALITALTQPNTHPPANDLRWCDATLDQMRREWGWNSLPLQEPADIQRRLHGRDRVNTSFITLSRGERDALIAAILPVLAPLARTALDRNHLDIPAELAACTTATIVEPGLTPDERSACEAVWKQAAELGLPDLTGASVQRGPYRYANNKDDQHQPLIHLSDGTWLVQNGIDVPAERISTNSEILRQPPAVANNQGRDNDRRLAASDQMRLRLNAIGRINSDNYWVSPSFDILAALAWWRSGNDPQGRSLVYALLRSDTNSRESISLSGYGGNTIVPPATPPTLADRLRLALVRLCRSRAIWAANRSDTVRWAEIARALVPPAERAAWEEPFSILIRRWDIPAKPSPTADFAGRLQCWDEWHHDPRTGKRLDSIKRPAERKDTDALIALLGDDRPSRWLDNDVMPRALGDVALRALCEVWRCDWRLVACQDPVTVQALGAKPSEGPREQPWTPALRHQIASSLQRWWQDAAHHDPDALYAAALPWLPVGNLGDVIKEHRRELGPLSADACAEIMRRNPLSNDREWLSPAHIFAMVCFPRHAGLDAALATWPTTPDITTLRGFRSALAGDAAQLDAWFDAAFAHSTAPERGWNSSPMHALRNLGLLTAAPTPARRDRVVALLAQPEDGPVLHELLPLLGQPYWPDLFGITKAPTASAIPAAVAMAALDDRRPAPSVEEPYHLEWKFREAMQRLAVANAPRICDATAAALIAERKAWDLEPLPDGVDKDAKRFLGRPVAERDKAIAMLKDAMQDVMQEAAEKVGWITTKEQADGNRF